MIFTDSDRDAMIEAMSGRLPEKWAGNCHGAAMALAAYLGPELATVRRGYFIGETTPEAYFHDRLCQHSWVELATGEVVDPTRFAFVGGEAWPPWIGPDDDYDIGGCKTTGPVGPPPNALESEREPIELNLGSVFYLVDLLHADPWNYAGDDEDANWLLVSVEQAAWLANLPIKDREGPGQLARWFAAEVYEALCDAGLSALIPIDRRDWILPERSKGRSSF